MYKDLLNKFYNFTNTMSFKLILISQFKNLEKNKN